MATWQKYDGLESAMAKAGGEIADVLRRLDADFGMETDRTRLRVMVAAQNLTDAMREARKVAHDVAVAERGYRR